MFSKNGYEWTTFERISKKANVGPGLIRYYFNTKEELYYCCAESALLNMMEYIRSTCDRLTGFDAVENFIEKYLRFSSNKNNQYQIIYTTSVYLKIKNPILLNKINEISIAAIGYLATKIAQIDPIKFNNEKSFLAAKTLIYTLHGTMRGNLSKTLRDKFDCSFTVKFLIEALKGDL